MINYVIFWVVLISSVVLALIGKDYIAYPLLLVAFFLRRMAVTNEYVDDSILSSNWKFFSLIYYLFLFAYFLYEGELDWRLLLPLLFVPFLVPLLKHELNQIKVIRSGGKTG